MELWDLFSFSFMILYFNFMLHASVYETFLLFSLDKRFGSLVPPHVTPIPSTRTMNLQAALFRAWSYALYRIMCIPSLKSDPDSGPVSVTLQMEKKKIIRKSMTMKMDFNKRKIPICVNTQAVPYQPYPWRSGGPRTLWHSAVLVLQAWPAIEGMWSLEARDL